MGSTRRSCASGFTLVELLVVLAVLGLLLALAAPRYIRHVDNAREVALRSDLKTMRDAIDRFHDEQGRYPGQLSELVDLRYLRALPPDPMTELATTWQVTSPPGGAAGVFDVHSGAPGNGMDGTGYATW